MLWNLPLLAKVHAALAENLLPKTVDKAARASMMVDIGLGVCRTINALQVIDELMEDSRLE